MKRLVIYAALSILAVVAGVSLAQAGSSQTGSRNEIAWAGLNCPAGDLVSSIHLDGLEMKGTSTPQAAVAPMVKEVAPELSFDQNAQKDLAPQASIAEFAVRDQQGNIVARFEANQIDGNWYPSGWTTCSSVGGANSPDPTPSPSPDPGRSMPASSN